MKLKKSQTETFITLTASEEVSPKEFQVLKAGLAKLLTTTEHPIILDLDTAAFSDPSVLAEVRKLSESLRAQAGCLPLFVRGKSRTPALAELSPEESLSEAEKKAASPLMRLSLLEPRLQKSIKELESKKAEADQRAKSLGNVAQDLRNARTENARLKRLIRGLERQLETIDRKRTLPLEPNPQSARTEEIEKTITQILTSQGLIAGGGK